MSQEYFCLTCNKQLDTNYKKKLCPCSKKIDLRADLKIQKDITYKIKKFFLHKKKIEKKKFQPGKTSIPLSIPTFSHEEVNDSLQSMLSTFVTMGDKVKKFEELFSKYLKIKNSVLVTNASAANLLALSVLTNPNIKNYLKPGDEIITPALTFATTVYPILDVGCVPVLCDIDLETLNIDEKQIEKLITKKTKALMPVHLLGNPCKIDKIKKIAKKYNLFLIEDAADSSGAEYHGKKVGTFGDMSTFSFFYTHIMTTIEGGMLCSNNDKFSELGKSKRAFGWIRDLKDKKKIEKKYKNIDSRFLFVTRGYNLKPTEIQGAFGKHQIKKLNSFVEARRKNANFWYKKLKKYHKFFITIREQPNTKSAWYGFPVIVQKNAPFDRKKLIEFLNKKGVATRPILSGNIAQQPVAK
ncbi:DegT/DnrJ/EryC1/StrS family aminotransferase [Candidatus Pelagibacter sp.]|nr:DegT/DnrJ/EryC1/StrS family aminotransferase [Candidatus Pelagibacter sp.]